MLYTTALVITINVVIFCVTLYKCVYLFVDYLYYCTQVDIQLFCKPNCKETSEIN